MFGVAQKADSFAKTKATKNAKANLKKQKSCSGLQRVAAGSARSNLLVDSEKIVFILLVKNLQKKMFTSYMKMLRVALLWLRCAALALLRNNAGDMYLCQFDQTLLKLMFHRYRLKEWGPRVFTVGATTTGGAATDGLDIRFEGGGAFNIYKGIFHMNAARAMILQSACLVDLTRVDVLAVLKIKKRKANRYLVCGGWASQFPNCRSSFVNVTGRSYR